MEFLPTAATSIILTGKGKAYPPETCMTWPPGKNKNPKQFLDINRLITGRVACFKFSEFTPDTEVLIIVPFCNFVLKYSAFQNFIHKPA